MADVSEIRETVRERYAAAARSASRENDACCGDGCGCSPADSTGVFGVTLYDSATREGVPDTAIRILPDSVINTEQEVQEAAREMQRSGKSRIIIVTSPEHTRRVKALWRKLAGDQLSMMVHPAHDDPFDADHWWRNTRDVFSVVRETLGLVNAWAGLPVPPHTD